MSSDEEDIKKYRDRVSGRNRPPRGSRGRRNIVVGISNLRYGESNNFLAVERVLLVQANSNLASLAI